MTLPISNLSEKSVSNGTKKNEENSPTMTQGDGVVALKVKRGQVIQKSYVLNDSGALKKKVRHENRKDPFNLGTEARDGSNMVVLLKTSFFEHVKANFINEVEKYEGIEIVQNAVGSKACTENSGDAFVEYSFDISFRAHDKIHTTKLTAYTTTCKMLFQPVGQTAQMKINPGNKSIPRFFVDTFFLPWCEEAYAKKTYNENDMIDAINEEIRRLDMLKSEAKKVKTSRGRLASVASSDVKCVAKGCKYTGLNSNNKSAVGACSKCGWFEHFECSKTKQEDRERIQKGEQKYFCTICFMNNPSMIAFDTTPLTKLSKETERSILHITSTTKATPIPPPIVPKIIFKCADCNFETESQEELKAHDNEAHRPECEVEMVPGIEQENELADNLKEAPTLHTCETCGNSFASKTDWEKHIVDAHNNQTTLYCTFCDTSFTSQSDIEAHIKASHSTDCPLCNLKFTDNEIFSLHIKNDHAPTCSSCDKKFANKVELENHIKETHESQSPHPCTVCDTSFSSKETLDDHTNNKHSFHCSWCQAMFIDQTQLETHMDKEHIFKCSLCTTLLKTKLQLDEHVLSNHSIACPLCPTKVNDKEAFSAHFRKDHTILCPTCGQEFENKDELNKHVKTEHRHICKECNEAFGTQTLLSKHTENEHRFQCTICEAIFMIENKLTEHRKEAHMFECEMCAFEGNTIAIMENHILEQHYSQDENNQFPCDECDYKCETREELGNHFREKHRENSDLNVIDEAKRNTETQNEANLKEELRVLKNNFERLESMFQDSLEEVNQVKSEYEAKLIEANDKVRIVKTENEELKENIDVLFKLGRSYINRKDKDNTEAKKNVEAKKDDIKDNDETETITVVEVTDEDLTTWTQNKFRGFRRSGPSVPPTKSNDSKPEVPAPKQTPKAPASDSDRNNQRPNSSPDAHDQQTKSSEANQGKTGRILYCHYFSNSGRCPFEERTGATCRYEHKNAPLCQSGTACMRHKCMYKHPNMAARDNTGRNNFLEQRSQPQQNPWQMMNPWWPQNTNQMQFPNPWMNMGGQGNLSQ